MKLINWLKPKRISLKLKIGFSVALFCMLAVVAAYIFLVRNAWDKQPVMLRILSGNVQVLASREEPAIPSVDNTWVDAGNYVRGQSDNSSALLQYFDGSAVQLDGVMEIRQLSSQQPKDARIDGARAIQLEVVRGKAAVASVRQASRRSLFEVQTSNSVGRVNGTVCEVYVNDQNDVVWEVSQGTARVAAISVGTDQRAVITLSVLKAGDSLSIPALSDGWQADMGVQKKLMDTAREIASDSGEGGPPKADMKGTTLLGFNPDQKTAVLSIDGVRSATPSKVGPKLVPPYNLVKDDLITRFSPALVRAKPPLAKQVNVRTLPPPQIWVKDAPKIEHKGPPAYLTSIYELPKPLGVAVDRLASRIYVTESDGNRSTLVFDESGNKLLEISPPSTSPAGRAPTYVAVDPRMGTIYVSDRMRHVIDRYDNDGSYLGTFSPKDAEIPSSPLGLSFSSTGQLYVTDVTGENHQVMVFDVLGGKLDLKFGKEGAKPGEFAFPNSAVADAAGQIYVADSNNFRLQAFNPRGEVQASLTRAAGQSIGFARGLDIEGDYLYVVDTIGHSVGVYNTAQNMKPVFSFGSLGIGDGEFNYPNSIAVDPDGKVFITDRENNRVQIWSY